MTCWLARRPSRAVQFRKPDQQPRIEGLENESTSQVGPCTLKENGIDSRPSPTIAFVYSTSKYHRRAGAATNAVGRIDGSVRDSNETVLTVGLPSGDENRSSSIIPSYFLRRIGVATGGNSLLSHIEADKQRGHQRKLCTRRMRRRTFLLDLHLFKQVQSCEYLFTKNLPSRVH